MEAQASGMRGSVLLLEDGVRVRHGAAPHLPDSWIRVVDGLEIGPKEGSCGTAAFTRKPAIASDIATDPRWVKYREAALAAGLRACWSVPFFSADGQVMGTFAQYYDRRRKPTAQELRNSKHAGHLAAIALQRHRNQIAIQESQHQLGLVYDHVADVLFELAVEPEGYRFVSVNPAFLKATGLPREIVVGRYVHEVIPEPSRSLVLRRYAEAIRSRDTVRWEEVTEYPTGARVGEVAVTPVFDERGQPAQLIGSVRDLTDRRQMENEVRQLQKLEAIGRLSGGIAHDFNNILAVILGVGNLLMRDIEDPALKAQLEEMLEAGRRGAKLTRQFLAFARKQVLQPQPLDLSATIQELQPLISRLLRADITLDLRLARGLPPVLGDPSQIEQVVLNLAVNARDAMPAGGTLTIEVAETTVDDRGAERLSLKPGRAVQLTVTDTGEGMTAETKRRIFEPFFTTKEAGKGTGLGLATVYGVVKQSGGAIEVDSEPGRGATFRILLPLAAGSVPASRERGDGRDSWGRGLSGTRILLVEDEPALRSAFSRMLERLKCQVAVAASGAEALTLVEGGTFTPDLLITDTVIPGLSGTELARRLTAANPKLKVLRMSGYTDPEINRAEDRLSQGTFLQKPFTIPELAEGVQRALNT